MSLTMIAICWNQRSLLRESTGIGRPFGARYSVSSMDSSPSLILTIRMRSPKTPVTCSYSSPATSTSDTFSNVKHAGVEVHRAIHVGDGDANRVYPIDQRLALLSQYLGSSQEQREHQDR